MRLSMISASVLAASAALALAACGGHGVVPSSQTGYAPMTSGANLAPAQPAQDDISPALTTCSKSPPQYDWIFKGACNQFNLNSSGGSFTLGSYQNITVKGSIGPNDAKGTVKVALADAIDKNGDITKFQNMSFPAYKARGTTIVYASANNESSQTIKPKPKQGHTVLQYIITDSKGIPGKSCGAALLGTGKHGSLQWTSFPGSYRVKGKTVTVSVYTAPAGFELPPKGTPLYFAINCF